MGLNYDPKVFEYLEFFAAAFDIPASQRKAIVEGVLELTDLQSKQRFADILKEQAAGLEAGKTAADAPEYQAYNELENIWRGFRYSVDEVLDGQILVLTVAEAASTVELDQTTVGRLS